MRVPQFNAAYVPTPSDQVVISVPSNCFNLGNATLRYIAGHQLMITDGIPRVFFWCRISGRAGYGNFDREALAEHGDRLFAHLISISIPALKNIKAYAGDDDILVNLVDAAIKQRKDLAIRVEGFGGYQISINREPFGLCCLPVRGNDTVLDVKKRYTARRNYAIQEM